jgi:hypothetical protein
MAAVCNDNETPAATPEKDDSQRLKGQRQRIQC